MFRGVIFSTDYGRYLLTEAWDRSQLPVDFDPEPLSPSEASVVLDHFAPDEQFGCQDDLRRFWSAYDDPLFSNDLSRRSDHQLYEALVREVCSPLKTKLKLYARCPQRETDVGWTPAPTLTVNSAVSRTHLPSPVAVPLIEPVLSRTNGQSSEMKGQAGGRR